MANQWATDARANPRWSAPEEQEAITTIQRLLLNQISPQQAAETIASTYDSCVKRGQGTSHMWDLWNIVYDAIDKLGNPTGNLDRMVRMMMAISALPDVLDEQGQVVKSTMNEQIFWRELPSFAFYFREVALAVITTENLMRGRPITWAEQIRKTAHANTFAALYLNALASNGRKPARDFRAMCDYSHWTLCDALEVPTDSIQQIDRTEMYVPGASQYILLAGELLWKLCGEKACNDGEMVIPRWVGGDDGGDRMWLGEEGFGYQRWAFWKQRFREIATLERAQDVVKRLAAEAEKAMGSIEGSKEAGADL